MEIRGSNCLKKDKHSTSTVKGTERGYLHKIDLHNRDQQHKRKRLGCIRRAIPEYSVCMLKPFEPIHQRGELTNGSRRQSHECTAPSRWFALGLAADYVSTESLRVVLVTSSSRSPKLSIFRASPIYQSL